jgi:hypothetical protein
LIPLAIIWERSLVLLRGLPHPVVDANRVQARTTVSAVWEDWMVVCAVRYEPVSLLFGQYQGDFRK